MTAIFVLLVVLASLPKGTPSEPKDSEGALGESSMQKDFSQDAIDKMSQDKDDEDVNIQNMDDTDVKGEDVIKPGPRSEQHGPVLTEELFVQTLNEAKKETEEVEKRTPKIKNVDRLIAKTFEEQHYKRYVPRLEPARINAMIMERTTRKLVQKLGISPDEVYSRVQSLQSASDHLERALQRKRSTIQCNRSALYRSVTGTCNNLRNPTFGAADYQFLRVLAPDYQDKISTPRVAKSGKPLPNARLVSRTLIQQFDRPSSKLSHISMIWGQFIDHDIALGAQPAIDCSTTDCSTLKGECFGIEIPKNDSAFCNRKCMFLKRDAPFPGTSIKSIGKPREHINIRSAFVDGSMIYGDEKKRTESLRKTGTSLLLVRLNPSNTPLKRFMDLLPAQKPEDDFCRSPDVVNKPCVRAGDVRTNENSGLTSMHTNWASEHNRIAKELGKLNSHWNADKVFLETRKIIGAMLQHITYNEFLPLILDWRIRRSFGLKLLSRGYFKGYNVKANPAIINSFATAAYRFGHSLVQNQFNRFGTSYRSITPPILMNRFLDSSFLYDVSKGGVDSIVRGLIKDPAQLVDGNFARAVQEQLVRDVGDLSDLAAINIQRAREHGNPGYNHYRELCGLPKATTFADFRYKNIMSIDQVKALNDTYDHPDDVDLYIGGLYEKPFGYGALGITFSCLLGKQFRKLRKGDRFWYENPKFYNLPRTGFTWQQLREIRKTTLARVICDNGVNIKYIRKRVMAQHSCRNKWKRCRYLKKVNLKWWKDKPHKG